MSDKRELLSRTKIHRHTSEPNDNVIHDHLGIYNDMEWGLAAHTHRDIENCGRAEWDFEKEGGAVVAFPVENGWTEPSETMYLLKGALLWLALVVMGLIWWIGFWTILFEWILGK